jgi:hypothetical protein
MQGAKKAWKPAPASLDLTLDYCQFANGADNPVINMFAPGLRKGVGSALRPCPYEVSEHFDLKTDSEFFFFTFRAHFSLKTTLCSTQNIQCTSVKE